GAVGGGGRRALDLPLPRRPRVFDGELRRRARRRARGRALDELPHAPGAGRARAPARNPDARARAGALRGLVRAPDRRGARARRRRARRPPQAGADGRRRERGSGSMSAEPVDDGFEELLELIKRERAFDFTGYKRPTLRRRVLRRMEVVGIDDFVTYANYVADNTEEFAHLFDTILIN